MDFHDIGAWLPQTLYAGVSVAVMYFLLQFKKRNDLAQWFKVLRASSARAVEDSNFRIVELRKAEADLADNPLPDSVVPMKRNHEYIIHALPKLLFLLGLGGFFILYLGLFRPEGDEGRNWMIVVGPVMLLAVAVGVFVVMGLRKNYANVQILNRIYIMQKAGEDLEGSLKTLDKIMLFYPAVPELWLDRADMLSKTGKLDEALVAIAKSRELSPADMDLAVIQAGYLLRKGDLAAAGSIVESLAGMRKAPTDPRPNLYAAALALARNDREDAKKEAEWAVKLDAAFIARFLPRDESLADLTAFMREGKLLAEGE